MTTKTRLSL